MYRSFPCDNRVRCHKFCGLILQFNWELYFFIIVGAAGHCGVFVGGMCYNFISDRTFIINGGRIANGNAIAVS